MVIADKSNILYLTGSHAENGILVVTGTRAAIGVPRLNYPAARKGAACRVMEISGLADFLSGFRGLTAIGYEPDIGINKFKLAKATLKGRWVESGSIVSGIRALKEPAELSKIRASSKLAVKVIEFARSLIAPGVSEKYIAREIDYYMKKEGADRPAFDTIVASGGNSADPHHVPSDRKLRPGDIITIDLGCSLAGYASDLTRTFFLGTITKYQKTVYDTVEKAQNSALCALRPGILCCAADSAARNFITKAGYGRYFIHSTGHGIGLETHEAPYLSPRSKAVLGEGMVVTVEPGIYIPDSFGVRLEDTVLITKDGCEVLTK
jgi:Xaa-Pro aminopeptidase